MKTFGIRDVSDLLEKLIFDIDRLERARISTECRYAAFDCAVVSWHLVDWLLNSVSDSRFQQLTGKRRGQGGANAGFLALNSHRLRDLATCQQIANTGKHLVLTLMPDDPSLSARSTVSFVPPFQLDRPDTWNKTQAIPAAMISRGDHTVDAVTFFRGVAAQWTAVLGAEGLLRPPEP